MATKTGSPEDKGDGNNVSVRYRATESVSVRYTATEVVPQ